MAGSLLSTAVAIPGLVLAAIGALSLAVEQAGRLGPVRALFPRRATQHVLTAVPEEGVVLVITAPYDAPRRGLVLNDRWRAPLRRMPAWTLAVCGAAVAAAAAARVAGDEPGWLGAVQLVPTIVLLVALAAATDVALSACSPGANDNASGVAVAMALFDELERDPPRSLRPALLLTGAGHAVPRVRGRPPARRGAGRRAGGGARARAVRRRPAGVDGPAPAGAGGRRARGRGARPRRGPAPAAPRDARAGHPHRLPGRARDQPARAPGGRHAGERRGGGDDAALDLALGVVDALDADLSARARGATSRA